VALIFFFGVGLGVAYGWGAGTLRNDRDVIRGMSQQMSTLGATWCWCSSRPSSSPSSTGPTSGLIIAVEGAHFLESAGLHQGPLMLSFILLSATINLVMGSASPSGR